MNEVNEDSVQISADTIGSMKIAKMFAESYIDVFSITNSKIGAKFSISPTFQKIKGAETRHKVSSLLDFTGGINGFVIINYTSESALDVVSAFLQGMGMSEADCPKSVSEEAVNTIGEITNQVLGGFRRKLEKNYGLSSSSGTPITMIMNTSFNMAPVDAGSKYYYVRAQINTPKSKAVFIEFCVQESVLVKFK